MNLFAFLRHNTVFLKGARLRDPTSCLELIGCCTFCIKFASIEIYSKIIWSTHTSCCICSGIQKPAICLLNAQTLPSPRGRERYCESCPHVELARYDRLRKAERVECGAENENGAFEDRK